MKRIWLVSLLLILLLFSGGCSSTEEVIEEEIVKEEIIEEEEIVWDDLFDLLGKDESFVLNYFPEEDPLIMESNFIFFDQNIVIYFIQEKVESVALFEGNKILGFIIEETFSEEKIVSLFGIPNEKGMEDETKYLTYFFGEIKVVFWEERDNSSPSVYFSKKN